MRHYLSNLSTTGKIHLGLAVLWLTLGTYLCMGPFAESVKYLNVISNYAIVAAHLASLESNKAKEEVKHDIG